MIFWLFKMTNSAPQTTCTPPCWTVLLKDTHPCWSVLLKDTPIIVQLYRKTQPLLRGVRCRIKNIFMTFFFWPPHMYYNMTFISRSEIPLFLSIHFFEKIENITKNIKNPLKSLFNLQTTIIILFELYAQCYSILDFSITSHLSEECNMWWCQKSVVIGPPLTLLF